MGCLIHKWDGCKCLKCEKVQDKNHYWENGICEKCGKQAEYVCLDFLSSEEIEFFKNSINDYMEKISNNPNYTVDAVLQKKYLARLDESAKITPFKMIKEDFKSAYLPFCTYIEYGWFETTTNSSDLEYMKAHAMAMELERRKGTAIIAKLSKLYDSI